MDATLEKVPSWLRWVLTPVATVLTFVIVSVVAGIAARIFVFIGGDRGWSINFFEYILIPGFAAYLAVLSTAILAPYGKQRTAVAYAAVWVCGCGFAAVFVFLSGEYKGFLPIISIAVGCAVAAFSDEL